MNDSQLVTLPQVTQFLAGTERVTFQPVSRDQIYEWIEQMLQRFGYHKLRKGDKSEVVKYMLKVKRVAMLASHFGPPVPEMYSHHPTR